MRTLFLMVLGWSLSAAVSSAQAVSGQQISETCRDSVGEFQPDDSKVFGRSSFLREDDIRESAPELLSLADAVTNAPTWSDPSPVSLSFAPSLEFIPNPERGLYHQASNGSPVSHSAVADAREEGKTLILRLFYLSDFVTSPLSDTYLQSVADDLQTIRDGGAKAIIRFAYVKPPPGATHYTQPYGDAAPARVTQHIKQLMPVLQAHIDVIAVAQVGFVGYWGEWYYTDTFGPPGDVTPADKANRRALVEQLAHALGPTRSVQIRSPRYKMDLFTPDALTDTECLSDSVVARIGHHNDCFLSSDDDYGTYADLAVEYPYLAADTRCTPMGGETCNVYRPKTNCMTALEEMEMFHWSYLNADYNTDVLDALAADGCWPEILDRLGYRLALTAATVPAEASQLGALRVQLNVQNSGFAAPINPRVMTLILRHAWTGSVWQVPLPVEPRRWRADNGPHAIDLEVGIPSTMPLGSYDVLLHLADPEPALHDRPEYAIQLANDGVWEAATGYNDLGHAVDIVASTIGPPYVGSHVLAPLPGCGDGVLQADEACDDADRTPGDGCSAACEVEPGFACAGAGPGTCTPDATYQPASCLDILTAGIASGDGPYVIDPDGAGGASPFTVPCDMTTDGGGWTLVLGSHTGDPGASFPVDTGYGTPGDAPFQLPIADIATLPQTEHILIRSDTEWLRIDTPFLSPAVWPPPAPGWLELSATATSASAESDFVEVGFADTDVSGGGWYGVAKVLKEESSSFHFLNYGCAGHYVYVYEENTFGTEVALGTGWSTTASCNNNAEAHDGVLVGVR